MSSSITHNGISCTLTNICAPTRSISIPRAFNKGRAQGKLTGCEQDLAINFPGCFRLLFLLSFIRKTKNARLKNPTDLLHKNVMKPLYSPGMRYLSIFSLSNMLFSTSLTFVLADCGHVNEFGWCKYWYACSKILSKSLTHPLTQQSYGPPPYTATSKYLPV